MLGACSNFNASSRYASRAAPVSELGNGGGAVVAGCRFRIDDVSGNRTLISLGDDTPGDYADLRINGSEGLELYRYNGTGDTTAILADSTYTGWGAVAARFESAGAARIAVRAPGSTSVTFVDDATTKALDGLDQLGVGALVLDAVSQYLDSAMCDLYLATSAAGVTDHAMERFCLGASPADVGAANHWPLQEGDGFADVIGGLDLTASGGLACADDGADVVVLRDLTSDAAAYPDHYAADVVGGAVLGGANSLSGAYTEPAADHYVRLVITVPDATPAADVTLWQDYGDANNWRQILLTSAGVLTARDRSGGSNSDATIAGAFTAGVPHVVVVAWSATGAARSVWCAPVGGAYSTGTEGTPRLPTTLGTLYLGANAGSSEHAESGTEIAAVSTFAAAGVSDEDAFLRSLLRNWAQNVPTPVHSWPLDGDAEDAVGSADLTFSASESYSDDLVLSSHYHLHGVLSGVTYDEASNDAEGDGSDGYLVSVNGMAEALGDPPWGLAARVRAVTLGTGRRLFSVTDGTNDERHELYHNTGGSVRGLVTAGGNAVPFTATGTVSNGATQTWGYQQIASNSRKVLLDDVETSNTATRAPAGLDRASFLRSDSLSPGDNLAAAIKRAAIYADVSEQDDADAWCEDAA